MHNHVMLHSRTLDMFVRLARTAAPEHHALLMPVP